MGGLFVCFSETAFNGMQTPAARLGSRPKRWLMCDWLRVLTQIQPGKEMLNSSSINTQPMSISANKRFGNLKQRKVIDLSAYKTGSTSDMLYRFHLNTDRLPVFSFCQPLWNAGTGDISWNSTNHWALSACHEDTTWQERRVVPIGQSCARRAPHCDAMFGPRVFWRTSH